jgi:hypothetical protein
MESLSGQLESADYLAALLLARRHNRVFKIVRTGVWVLVAVLFVPYAVIAFSDPRFATQLLVLVAVAGVLVIERRVLLPMRAKRIYRQQRSMQEPFEVKFGDEGVEWHSALSTKRLPWDYYVRCSEGPEHFLLYQSDWSFEVLPKRFFRSEAQMAAFREVVRQNLAGGG